MKSPFRKALITFLFLFFIKINVFSQLVLTYPHGGETLVGNSIATIRWTMQTSSISSVDIYYSIDNGQNWCVIARWLYPYKLSFDWLVPQICSNQLRIKICDTYNSNDFYISNVCRVIPNGNTIMTDTTWSGTVNINRNTWVGPDATLTITSGTKIRLEDNLSLEAVNGGRIIVDGTEQDKVTFYPSGNGFFGQISADGNNSKLIIKHAEIVGGQVKVSYGAKGLIEDSYFHDFPILKDFPSERISIFYASFADSITIRNCHFNNYFQVNIANTKSLVEDCLFENWLDDGIDYDNSPIQTLIRNCTFRNGIGYDKDAIDFGEFNFQPPGSKGKVENCLIYNITDKGISIGEDADSVIATNNVIYNCGYGIAVKDDSKGFLYHNTISKCEIGIGLYEKNIGFGGSHASCHSNITFGNTHDIVNSNSILQVDYSNIGNSDAIGTNNISQDPLFVDSNNNNFQLAIGSPCIGTGFDGQNMGADFPIGNATLPNDYWSIFYPAKLDKLYGDSVYSIQFITPANISNVNIDFSSDNGLNWSNIVSNLNASTGLYNWAAPNIWSEKCLLKILDSSNSDELFTSPFTFTILPNGTPTQVPEFSVNAGYFNSPFYLSITSEPGASIYYTVDGSEPTVKSNLYSNPIFIYNKTNEPNGISMIPTTPGNPLWIPPIGNVFKGNVVKAIAYKIGNKASEVVTNSYFVDSLMPNRFHMPVISITTDSSLLFDYYKGIYIPGASYNLYSPDPTLTGNYLMDIEIPANFEYFERNGKRQINQLIGVRTRGQIMYYPQKGFNLYARAEYGQNYFNYQFFPDKSDNKFKRLSLRTGGTEYDGTFFVDDAAANVIKNLKLEIMYSQPVVSFINGEYFGIMQIRDKLDKHYLKTKYNLSDLQRDNFDIIENGGASVSEGDFEFYYFTLFDLENDILSNNFVLSNNGYNIASKKIDLENFIDYLSSEIYFANYDWPGWNELAYRYRTNFDSTALINILDGRLRWMIKDIDAGFGGWYRSPDFNAMEHATKFDPNDPYHGLAPVSGATLDWPWGSSTFKINALLSNPTIKNNFINRFSDLLNSTFKEERVDSIVNDTYQQYLADMQEHINRWNYPISYNEWQWRVQFIFDFANNRPPYARQHIMDHFGLTNGTANITLDVSNQLQGKVEVNSLSIDKKLDGVSNSAYPWTGIYFKDLPVRLIAKPFPGYKFVDWSNGETNDTVYISLLGDSTITANFEIDSIQITRGVLFINEFMAANTSTLADEYGQFDDWIELYNSSNDTINLANYYITDKLDLPQKYKIIDGGQKTKVSPRGFLLLWADEDLSQGANHVGIKLSANGEAIGITSPNGITLIDSISFGLQSPNVSYGRKTDGDSTWVSFTVSTPNASNNAQGTENFSNPNAPFFIYPNPVQNDFVYLSKQASGKLYNSFGQLAIEFNQLTSIDVSALNNGIYLLWLKSGERKKLIIRRN